MKREGRQHGVVRKGKEITTNASGVVVDLARARAPLKPSNHSKHTGKCRKARCVHCHLHPVSKSRDKAKGSYKLKSSDVVLNHRLLTWRVAPVGSSSSSTRDILNWNKYSGASASGILDALATSDSCYWSSGGDDCEDQGSDYEENYIAEEEEEEHEDNNDDDEEDDEKEDEDEDEDEGDEDEDEDEGEEDDMGFCQVGMVWEYMDEEGWCVLGEN